METRGTWATSLTWGISSHVLNIVLQIRYYLPSWRMWLFFLSDALCQVWLKLAQWFCRRRILNIINIILLFRHYFPMEKDVALHLNKLESPPPKDALCQVRVVLDKIKMWKIYGQTERRMTGYQKSSLEPLGQVS